MNAWKQDADKPRMDLLPPELVQGVATVMTFGAGKYTDRNWEKGMAWGRVFGALQRHMWAFWSGEDRDPETGLPHTHHAACCIAFLMAYEARQIGIDDRAKRAPATLPREGLPFDAVKAERDAAREQAMRDMAERDAAYIATQTAPDAPETAIPHVAATPVAEARPTARLCSGCRWYRPASSILGVCWFLELEEPTYPNSTCMEWSAK